MARPTPALEPYADLLRFAETPEGFVAELERAVAEDSPEQARARRRRAEESAWERRLEELDGLLEEVLARKG